MGLTTVVTDQTGIFYSREPREKPQIVCTPTSALPKREIVVYLLKVLIHSLFYYSDMHLQGETLRVCTPMLRINVHGYAG